MTKAKDDGQAIKQLCRLETIERLLNFDFSAQCEYADEIAEERQRLTLQTRRATGNR